MSRALAAFSRVTGEIKAEKERADAAYREKMERAVEVLRSIDAELAPIFELRPDLNRTEPAAAKVISGVARYEISIPWRAGKLGIKAECGTEHYGDPLDKTFLKIELYRAANATGEDNAQAFYFDWQYPSDASEFIAEWLARLIEEPWAKITTATKQLRVVKRGRSKKRGGH